MSFDIVSAVDACYTTLEEGSETWLRGILDVLEPMTGGRVAIAWLLAPGVESLSVASAQVRLAARRFTT